MRLASVLLAAMLAAGARTAQEPVLTDEIAKALLDRGRSVLDPAGNKQSLRVTQKHAVQDEEEQVWLLQLEWTEAGSARKGIVFAGRVGGALKEVSWAAQVDGWGMSTIRWEDRELSSFVSELGRMQIEANEAAAIGDLRAFTSAELTYQAANSGFFGTPACLREPKDCIPGYPPLAPSMLREDLMGRRKGYLRKFHPGAKAASPGPNASPSSLDGFVVTAVPIRPGETGKRGFCSDMTGIICFTADGSEPLPSRGICPVADKKCEPIS